MLHDLELSTRMRIKCELKNRRDVINKSILRAIKRYFTNEFRVFYEYKRFKVRGKMLDHFEESLKQFVKAYGWVNDSEFCKLLGFLLDSEMFAEVLSRDGETDSTEIKKFADAFNDC